MSKKDEGATGGAPAVGREELARASQILLRYRASKSALDARILENERWMNDRCRGIAPADKKGGVRACSAWLYNCIENKLADMMDNFPSPNILPREEGDREEAKRLSMIVPVILDGCGFEETYRSVCACKLKHGTGIYGVFWDARKNGGLGDVDVRKVRPVNFFAEPGVTDVQASRNVFLVEYFDRETLEEDYPEIFGDKKTVGGTPAEGSDGRIEVVFWYYKKRQEGKTVLHFCKFTGDVVLYATENEKEPVKNRKGEIVAPPPAECGLYRHGLYPFVVDAFITSEESIWGSGYIDVGRNAQEWIDLGNEALLKSMQVNAKPRFFVRANAEINKEEFADLTNEIVTFTGNDPNASVMPIVAQPVSSVYLAVLQSKIAELKETTGNRDVSTGGTTGGVTAAAAIAAMQEAAGKSSRELNKQTYRAYKKIVLLVIELIRQFYDVPRQFRILGRSCSFLQEPGEARGGVRFVSYSNEGLAPKHSRNGGLETLRIPQMDVEVTAEKQSLYSKISQNELALQLYNAGFFAPGMRSAALSALEMMDFDRKEFVVDLIARQAREESREEKASGAGARLLPGALLEKSIDVKGGESRRMREARLTASEAPKPR